MTRPHPAVSIEFTEETRTRQSFKDECDIRTILARYVKTGAIDHFARHGASYGDFPAVDFLTAMQITAQAQSMFNDLPSAIRERFDNDPAAFLEFAQDPANADEMVEMGLSDQPVPDWAPDGPGHPPRRPPGRGNADNRARSAPTGGDGEAGTGDPTPDGGEQGT